MERWTRRFGERVTLTSKHREDGVYELLHRIDELETELEIQEMKYRTLSRNYEIAKTSSNRPEESTCALL